MKKILVCFVVVAVVLSSVSASAGYRSSDPVNIYGNSSSGGAYGSQGSARNSTDAVQYIGCALGAQVGSTPSVSCTAKNAAGTTVSCSSSDANLVATARAIDSDSWIWFFWTSANACSGIVVNNSSQFPPKTQ